MNQNSEYANAYTEVIEILNYISLEEFNKIPKKKIEFFNKYANHSYQFIYDSNKTLSEQNVSQRAKAILSILYRDYFASDDEKNNILNKEKEELTLIEDEKRNKYNPDKIFNNIKEERKSDNIYNVNNKLKLKENRSIITIIKYYISKILKKR